MLLVIDNDLIFLDLDRLFREADDAFYEKLLGVQRVAEDGDISPLWLAKLV